ncbi:MAG TPA: LuxR C-terminal-related transcriptional regulator, partial [Jatrophihabitans sp.]|nr:LuxR C-terminal-related transcriptional regulator [Jatrophihabitans sp.]
CVRSSPDPRRAAIAALLTTHDGDDRAPITVTSDPGLQFRVVDACTDLVEDLALAGPLVLAADDLQWADPSSLLTLGAAVRRLSDLPVALVACFRPIPRSAELDQLVTALHSAGAGQLHLGPLSDMAVQELAAEMTAAEPGSALLTGLSGAAGNPLFVTELIGALNQAGAIHTDGGRAEVTDAALPPTLRLTILHRLSFLPESALEVLRAASILGSTFSLTDLAAVTARSMLELSEAVTPALQAGVVIDEEVTLRFRHDLIRDAIYADLPVSVRRGLHREVGQRLAGSNAPALQVAEQLARGAEVDDAEAIEWLTRAARDAAPTSSDVAAELLERAVSLMSATNPDRDRLLLVRAGQLMAAGRVGDALTACRELLDRRHDPAVDVPARISHAHALLAYGRASEALAELERAADSTSLSGGERASALAWAGFARLSLADLPGAAARAEEARVAAAAADAHFALSIAMVTLAVVAECRGHVLEALRIIDDGIWQADHSAGRQGQRYPIHMTRGHILIELDRLEDAGSTLRTGIRLSEELGVRWPLASYAAYRALAGFLAGQWDDAIAEIDASLELAAETGETYSSVQAHTLMCLIRLHRNDLAGAAVAADAAMRTLGDGRGRFRAVWAQWAHALVLEARNEIRDAFTTLAECWDRCAHAGIVLEYRTLGPDVVRLALACDERELARNVATALAGVTDDNPTISSLSGAALRCQGLVEEDAGILLKAVDAYCSGSRPLELALTCEDAATAFARRGEPDRARPLLDRAIEGYERLDAARDRARAEAVARAAGIRRGRRGPRARQQTGWHSLTPTERTIATLVAAGLSNPQIGDRLYISRRTVQAHLAHIFPKLDIASRSQLAAEASRRQANAQLADRPSG